MVSLYSITNIKTEILDLALLPPPPPPPPPALLIERNVFMYLFGVFNCDVSPEFIISGSGFLGSARRFVSDVVDVRSIGTHFQPKIEGVVSGP